MNYLYYIRILGTKLLCTNYLCKTEIIDAKNYTKKETNTQKNVDMYNECNSLTSRHKITLDGVICY